MAVLGGRLGLVNLNPLLRLTYRDGVRVPSDCQRRNVQHRNIFTGVVEIADALKMQQHVKVHSPRHPLIPCKISPISAFRIICEHNSSKPQVSVPPGDWLLWLHFGLGKSYYKMASPGGVSSCGHCHGLRQALDRRRRSQSITEKSRLKWSIMESEICSRGLMMRYTAASAD
jgi:hypothetical protein